MKLSESITIKDIEKYHKECQYFTKNILNIKNGKQLFDVAIAARLFRDDFEHFFYKQFAANTQVKDSMFFTETSKEVWELILNLDKPFSSSHYLGFNDYYMNEDFPKYMQTYNGAWDKIYILFDEKRKKAYSYLGRLVREAFDNIYKLYDVLQNQELADMNASEDFYYKGTKTVIYYNEIEDKRDKYISLYVKGLDSTVGFLKDLNLDYILKQIEFMFDTSSYSLDVAGRFHGGLKNVVEIYPQHTEEKYYTIMLHEIGHYVYDRLLPKDVKKVWDDLINNNYFPPSKDIENDIVNTVNKLYKKGDYRDIQDYFEKKNKTKYGNEDEFNSLCIQHTLKFLDKDSYAYRVLFNFSTEDWIPTLVPLERDYTTDKEKDDRLANALNFFISAFPEMLTKYGKFLKKNITLYAGKNSEEAFCETFSLVIGNRWRQRQVDEEVVNFFLDVIKVV